MEKRIRGPYPTQVNFLRGPSLPRGRDDLGHSISTLLTDGTTTPSDLATSLANPLGVPFATRDAMTKQGSLFLVACSLLFGCGAAPDDDVDSTEGAAQQGRSDPSLLKGAASPMFQSGVYAGLGARSQVSVVVFQRNGDKQLVGLRADGKTKPVVFTKAKNVWENGGCRLSGVLDADEFLAVGLRATGNCLMDGTRYDGEYGVMAPEFVKGARYRLTSSLDEQGLHDPPDSAGTDGGFIQWISPEKAAVGALVAARQTTYFAVGVRETGPGRYLLDFQPEELRGDRCHVSVSVSATDLVVSQEGCVYRGKALPMAGHYLRQATPAR